MVEDEEERTSEEEGSGALLFPSTLCVDRERPLGAGAGGGAGGGGMEDWTIVEPKNGRTLGLEVESSTIMLCEIGACEVS